MADDNNIIDEYGQAIKSLTNLAVQELKIAHGNKLEIRNACCRYFKRGFSKDISNEELIDYLGVSGTVCDEAGYTDEEIKEVWKIIADISDQEIKDIEI
jgi:hypothetical protein